MAIHYLVKLPMASLEPHGGETEREREREREGKRERESELSSCNGPCRSFTGYHREERLEETLDTQEAAEPDTSVIIVVIHILVLLLV